MPIYFAPSSGGFLSDDIHGDIPDTALEITAERHAELMQAQAEGQIIAVGEGGYPVAADPAPPSDEQLLASMRRRRNRLLSASDFTQQSDAPFTATQKAAWKAYRKVLRNLPETITDPAAIVWPAAPNEAETA